MKLTQEPRVSLGVNIVQVSVVGGLVIGALAVAFFMFGGLFSSNQSSAANSTIASGSSVAANTNPFSSLSNGDSIIINGTFNVNQDYVVHANNAITVVVDGSNAELVVFKNRKLVLGTGSEIILTNGGELSSTGNCQSSAEIYFGSSLVANCPGTGTASFSSVNSGGGIGANGVVLPVSWLDVNATSSGEQVEISWSTASEKNNSHFQLEFSDDGEFWNTGPQVNSMAENGFSEEILKYTAVHHPPAFLQRVFYRIKQIDYDGQYDYSDIMSVKLGADKKVIISTLGSQQIKVGYPSEFGQADLNIYNESGMKVLTGAVEQNKLINLPHPGVYIIEVIDGSEVKRVKHLVR